MASPENLDIVFQKAVATAIERVLPDLGYLALTSKPEHAIRDAIALSLFRDPALSGKSVAREFHLTASEQKKFQAAYTDGNDQTTKVRKGGIDLAIVDGEIPILMAEFKALYTFDMGPSGSQLCRSMKAGIDLDVARTKALAAQFDHAYVVVAALLPYSHRFEADHLLRTARYRMARDKARVAKHPREHEPHVKNLREYLSSTVGNARVEASIHECGEAYGTKFQLHSFVLRVK